MARQLLCLGYGFTAAALARRLRGQGWRLAGTTRSGLGDGAVEIIAFNGTLDERLRFSLQRADAVLISIPPDEAGCPAFRACAEAIPRSAWVGYLSTTGVYGDLAGGWAFETSPRAPSSDIAARRVMAELQWENRAAHIFRLPGIYGPGRSAFDRLRAGDARRIVKPGQVFSRAHVDDIAAALAFSIDAPNPFRIYNVCDDLPAPPQDVITHAARLLHMTPPPLEPYEAANLSPMAQRFYLDSKRVSNARLKAELGWRPLFPTYREGLAAILAAEHVETHKGAPA